MSLATQTVSEACNPALRSSTQRFEAVVAGLMRPAAYPHEVDYVRRIDTHISVVLLAGQYAYKVKKPVRLEFLDFSSLEQRHAMCLREVQLNQRTAPAMYLGVEEVTETPGGYRVGGDGMAVEYVVKMLRFADDARLDQVLARGALDMPLVRQLADDIASFHACAEVAPRSSKWGTPAEVETEIKDNFAPLFEHAETANLSRPRLTRLHDTQLAAIRGLADSLRQRHLDGYVRDCHGDLHLANIALVDGRAVAFDCIEFNEAFRWVDVMSDLAFLLMDLDHRGASSSSAAVLNRYLEHSGDFSGLTTLRSYQGYRAMVRAKIGALRLAQCSQGSSDAARCSEETGRYLSLAER